MNLYIIFLLFPLLLLYIGHMTHQPRKYSKLSVSLALSALTLSSSLILSNAEELEYDNYNEGHSTEVLDDEDEIDAETLVNNSKKNSTTKAPRSSPPTIFETLLGDTLYAWGADKGEDGKDDIAVYEISTKDLLKNKKVIGLYFSASWCGPCKQFTPVLAKFYEDMNKQHGDTFEIVWISHDRTSEDFFAYYQHMPWLALPIPQVSTLGNALVEKYQAKGIPHLVLLDGEDAAVYTLDGRSKILQDKYGVEFPYKPRSLMSFVPRPVKRFFSNALGNIKTRLMKVIQSILEGLIPKRLLNMLFHRK